MADGAFNPSRCEIKTARIIPHTERGGEGYDVSLMIGDFRMSQDMNLVAINGSFDVLDNIGLLQNVPFRGEEELEFTLTYKETDWNTLESLVNATKNRGR